MSAPRNPWPRTPRTRAHRRIRRSRNHRRRHAERYAKRDAARTRRRPLMRLIDAENFKRRVRGWGMTPMIAVGKVLEAIDKQPTATPPPGDAISREALLETWQATELADFA